MREMKYFLKNDNYQNLKGNKDVMQKGKKEKLEYL